MRDIARAIRATIEAEEASGWALIRKIPCTYTWKALDYIVGLSPAERESVFAAAERNALFLFDPPPDPSQHAGRWPAFAALCEAAFQRLADWKYMDVRTLRAILGNVRGKRPDPAFAKIPAAVLDRAAAIKPTSAPEIRNAVKAAVNAHFGAKPVKRGGGYWDYAGSCDGLPFELSVDYGGKYAQLRYALKFTDAITQMRAKALVYERVMGLGLGDWDFITADNVADSADLLCVLVEKLLAFPSLALAADA